MVFSLYHTQFLVLHTGYTPGYYYCYLGCSLGPTKHAMPENFSYYYHYHYHYRRRSQVQNTNDIRDSYLPVNFCYKIVNLTGNHM